MQNTVRFSSELFNTTVVHEHFVNPCCFGEDVGAWLRPRLEAKGYQVDEPGQEDWGWYLGCGKDDATNMICIGLLDDENPEWQVILEVQVPFLKKIFRPKPEVPAQLRHDIHAILESEPEIRGINWLNLDGVSELNRSARPE